MIYYISVRNKIENDNIRKTIKEFDKNPTIVSETKNINDDIKNIKKAKIIITDYDKGKIEEYNKYKKIVIVFTSKKKTPEELLDNKNCFTYKKRNELREILCYQLNQRNHMKKILFYSPIVLIGIIILIGGIMFSLNKIENTHSKEKEETKEDIKEEEENKNLDPKKAENIVFLGDSLTEEYDILKFFGDYPSINSGVSGYCTDNIIDNLENFVYEYNPTKVVLLIGTNDICIRDYGNTGIVDNIKKIVRYIKKNRSKAKIYVESLYPVNGVSTDPKISQWMVGDRTNSQIIEINKLLKKMCEEEKVEYIDMYQELIDEEGNLNVDYTRDGLHMSEEGYKVVTKKIKEVLEIND